MIQGNFHKKIPETWPEFGLSVKKLRDKQRNSGNIYRHFWLRTSFLMLILSYFAFRASTAFWAVSRRNAASSAVIFSGTNVILDAGSSKSIVNHTHA